MNEPRFYILLGGAGKGESYAPIAALKDRFLGPIASAQAEKKFSGNWIMINFPVILV